MLFSSIRILAARIAAEDIRSSLGHSKEAHDVFDTSVIQGGLVVDTIETNCWAQGRFLGLQTSIFKEQNEKSPSAHAERENERE